MDRFTDLPKEAQDMFRDLDFDSAKTLAIQAGAARRDAELASYPKDPVEALKGIGDAQSRTVSLEIDDPVGFALNVIDVAALALEEDGFDSYHATRLAALLSLASTAMFAYRENAREASDRLWALQQALK